MKEDYDNGRYDLLLTDYFSLGDARRLVKGVVENFGDDDWPELLSQAAADLRSGKAYRPITVNDRYEDLSDGGQSS
jgi:hypothetical protein